MISGTETLARKLDMAVIYWDMEKPAADVTASPADSSARTRRNARAQHNTQLCGNASGNYRTQPLNLAMDSQPMEIPRTTPLIAVVILNWNGAHLLREYLPLVVATTDSRISRIIVADNGSTDDSLNYVRQTFPKEWK